MGSGSVCVLFSGFVFTVQTHPMHFSFREMNSFLLHQSQREVDENFHAYKAFKQHLKKKQQRMEKCKLCTDPYYVRNKTLSVVP